ncbi:13581_t:CDS:2 [Ambispora gerdemannii]|uniref:13581_t:CDS:1 n=1 Tax=Ambispora gerdemannii TaxID=144530 RepID=A0A9N8ZYA6_9GLOM|nr:13581_t:CDS:2 [Ambispora gerdemannii]
MRNDSELGRAKDRFELISSDPLHQILPIHYLDEIKRHIEVI